MSRIRGELSAGVRVLRRAAYARLVAEDRACFGLIVRVEALAGCGDEQGPQLGAAERARRHLRHR